MCVVYFVLVRMVRGAVRRGPACDTLVAPSARTPDDLVCRGQGSVISHGKTQRIDSSTDSSHFGKSLSLSSLLTFM